MAITPCRPKWPGTMTDRERFNAQMHFQPVDRCFNMEFGYWGENFELWSGFVENGIKNNNQADEFFSFDQHTSCGPLFLHPPMPEKVLEEKETTRIIVNSQGLIAEVPKDGHSTIPHFLGSTLEEPKDWDRVKKEHFDPDHPDRQVDVAALKTRFADSTVPVCVHCGSMIGRIRDLLTVEGLAYAMYDYPEMVEDMVETACVLVERFLDQVLPEIQFDYAGGWEDICFKNGPLVNMRFFNDVCVPRYKRIGAKLKAAGIDVWYTDCDGDVRPLIPGFLESGLNCMFPWEVMGSGHPGETLDKYGDRLLMLGGVDKTKMAGGPDVIRPYLESLVPYVERGGFIPFCDHRCPPDVSWEDYLYYLDLKRELFCRPFEFKG